MVEFNFNKLAGWTLSGLFLNKPVAGALENTQKALTPPVPNGNATQQGVAEALAHQAALEKLAAIENEQNQEKRTQEFSEQIQPFLNTEGPGS